MLPPRLAPRIPLRGSGTVKLLRSLVRTRSGLQGDRRERRAAAWRPPASGHWTLRYAGLEDHPLAHAPRASFQGQVPSNGVPGAGRTEKPEAVDRSSGSADSSNGNADIVSSSNARTEPPRSARSHDALRQRSLSPSQRALTAATGNAIPVTPERAERVAAAMQSTGATTSVPRSQRQTFLRSALSVNDLQQSSSPAGTLGNGTTRTEVIINQFPLPPGRSPERSPERPSPTTRASVWSLFPSTPQVPRSCPSISQLFSGSVKQARSWSANLRGVAAGETDPDYAPVEASLACQDCDCATDEGAATSSAGNDAENRPATDSPAAVARLSAESQRAIGNGAARFTRTPLQSQARRRQPAERGQVPVHRRSLTRARNGGTGPRLPIAIPSETAQPLQSVAPHAESSLHPATQAARNQNAATTISTPTTNSSHHRLHPRKLAKALAHTLYLEHTCTSTTNPQPPSSHSPPLPLLTTVIPNLDGDSAAWSSSPLRQTRSNDVHQTRHHPSLPTIPTSPYALTSPGRTHTNLLQQQRFDSSPPPQTNGPAGAELRPETSHQSITVPSVPSLEPQRSRPNFRIRRLGESSAERGGGKLGRAKATWRTRMAATKCWRCEIHEAKLKGWAKVQRMADFSCCFRFRAYEEDEDELLVDTAERSVGMELVGPGDGGFGGRQSVEVSGVREDVADVGGR